MVPLTTVPFFNSTVTVSPLHFIKNLSIEKDKTTWGKITNILHTPLQSEKNLPPGPSHRKKCHTPYEFHDDWLLYYNVFLWFSYMYLRWITHVYGWYTRIHQIRTRMGSIWGKREKETSENGSNKTRVNVFWGQTQNTCCGGGPAAWV